MFIRTFVDWMLELTGSRSSSSMAYNFWSGFGGDVTIIASLLTAPIIAFRRHNCHVKRCWRIGHHDYTDNLGVTFKMCRRHHPDHPGDALTAEQITAVKG